MSRLRTALSHYAGRFEPAEPVYLASIVEEATDPNYVTVDMLRPDGSAGERRDVLKGNGRVWPGLIVRVAIERKQFGPGELAIVGVDRQTYAGSETPRGLPLHGEDHGYKQIDETANLHTIQLFPVRAQWSTGLTVLILQGWYYAGQGWSQLREPVSVDLTAYKPAGSQKRYVTLSLTGAGAVTVTAGAAQATPLSASDAPDAPLDEFPVALVELRGTDTSIDRDRIKDVRFMHTSAGSLPTAADGQVLVYNATTGKWEPEDSIGIPGMAQWGNVIVVAESGGQHTTVQAGHDAGAAGDIVFIMPATYAENVAWTTAALALHGLDPRIHSGPYGAYLTGADDVGPILDIDAGGNLSNIVVNRGVTAGSGEFIGVDASPLSNIFLTDCRIAIGHATCTRNLIGLKVGAGTGSEVQRCWIAVLTSGTETAISLTGGTIRFSDCIIDGDIVAAAACTLILRNCAITGDVTGMAGADLYLSACAISGTISGWDSVTYDLADEIVAPIHELPVLVDATTGQGVRYATAAAALATAGSGDVLRLPALTFAETLTIPAGVHVIGLSRYATIITGQITLGAGASLECLSVTRSANDATDLKGVVAPATGTAKVRDCDVMVTQSGAGDGYAVSVESAGTVEVWSCYLNGQSVGGSGYAGYIDAAATGSLVMLGGWAIGSTDPFNE